MKKILITGVEGFIGSHLAELAVERGYEVVGLGLYNSFGNQGWLANIHEKAKTNLQMFWGDIRDRGCVFEAMKGCDAVLNLAALIAIPYSYKAPESYVDTNIKGALNVFENARLLGLKKLVHVSTSEVYGTAQYVPIDEAHPLNAQSPYAATKIAADQLALSYFRSFDLPVAIARPFNTYGPRQSNRAVIPTIITQLASGARMLKLGSLAPTRDFSFVKDTAAGLLAVMESAQSIGTVINIGSNFEVSIGETAKIISELMNCELDIQHEIERTRPSKSEVERLFADTTKAQQLLEWKPEFSGLQGFKKGLSLTIEWFLHSENLRKYNAFDYVV